MKIKYVTLTGADDSVDAEELFILSNKFPFVEWGILFSQSKCDVPRYPSIHWVNRLVDETLWSKRANLAAHLCGKWTDDVMKGEMTFLRNTSYDKVFDRIQLNVGSCIHESIQSNMLQAISNIDPKTKVMLGGNYSKTAVDGDVLGDMGISPLFDASGGNGKTPDAWPSPLRKSSGECILSGYAGGLGPDNISSELDRISRVVGDETIWIDMESKLRTKRHGRDVFDLEKCEHVLEAVKAWV